MVDEPNPQTSGSKDTYTYMQLFSKYYHLLNTMNTLEQGAELGISSEKEIENEVERKFQEYVIAYVLEFEKKLEEYAEEADIGGTAKNGKTFYTLVAPLATAASVGVGLAEVGKVIESGWKYISNRNHRKKSKSITQIFQAVKSDELRKIFVQAASLIFFSFESQFRLVTDADGNWKRGLKKLANDACKRSISYIYNEKERLINEAISRDLLTKALTFGESKDSFISSVAPAKLHQFFRKTKPGHNLKHQTSLTDWNTSDIYENVGIKLVGCDGKKRYYRKKLCDNDFGYRWSFSWENDSYWISKYEEYYQGETEDSSTFLKFEALEAKMDLVLESINKEDPKLKLKRIENGVDETMEKLETLKASQSEMIEVVAKQEDIVIMKQDLNEIKTTISSSSSKGEKRKIFNVKEPVKTFTGRERQLTELHNALQTHRKQVVVSQCVSISGLGGMGKSELVRKYACTFHESYDSIVIWIDSETQLSTKNSFHRLAEKLQISTTQKSFDSRKLVERDLLLIVEDIYEYFADSKSLFIFDNANQFEEISDLLPSSLSPTVRKPAIIITSRSSDWDIGEEGDVDVIMLDEFTPDEALIFIKKVLEVKDNCHDNLIFQLTQKLCYFPLALRQAASYIKTNGTLNSAIEKYLTELCDEEKKRDLLQYKTKLDRYTETTYTTWQITFRHIKKNEVNGPLAIRLVEMMAYLAADEIRIEKTFIKIAKDGKNLKEAIDILLKYSIITVQKNVGNIHRLVQQVIRLWLQDKKMEKKVLTVMLTEVQRDVDDHHIVPLWTYACKYTTLIDDYFCKISEETKLSMSFINPLDYLVREGNVTLIKKILDHLERRKDLWRKLISKINDGNCVKCTQSDASMENVGPEKHMKNLYLFHAEVYNALKHSNSTELERFLHSFDRSLINSWFDGRTALHKSARRGNLNVVKILIENGADINFLSLFDDTPLHAALDWMHFKVVEYLLDQGADSKIANGTGWKAIHYAADSGYLNIVQRLAKTKEECESRTALNWTPLHFAAQNDHVEIIEFFVNCGVDVSVLTNGGQTACHIAVKRGSMRVVKYLIHNRLVDVNIRDGKSEPLLNTAVSHGQFDIVKYLLSNETHDKADINACNLLGATPLFLAVLNYHMEIAAFLIEHGADVENFLVGSVPEGPIDLQAALERVEKMIESPVQLYTNLPKVRLDTSDRIPSVERFFDLEEFLKTKDKKNLISRLQDGYSNLTLLLEDSSLFLPPLHINT